MRWPWTSRKTEPVDRPASIATPSNLNNLPQLEAHWLLRTGRAGAVEDELEALHSSALYRGVQLVAGTLAGLPFNSFTGTGQDRRMVPSVFDNPDPDGQTPFEWKETSFTHLMLYGRCGALKVKNAAGGLAALPLVHPNHFTVRLPTQKDEKEPAGGVWFDISLENGRAFTTDADGFFYVPALSLDGRTGVGLLELAAESIGITLAGDTTASSLFSSGATISGLATPDYDDEVDITDDVPEIRRQLNAATSGEGNAGKIALVNRRLKFTPWTMTAQQAQVLESRQFQIEEIARWTGVPPHLLMQTDKQTSWGTGVDEQNRGLSKFVLGHWASRFEQRASRLLANPRWTEFDFAGLERPNFAVEIDLLMKQTGGKPILTVNEARAVRNLPPVEGGDVLMAPPAPAPATEPNAGGDDDPPTD
jgi:HK97 family phage portal protein